MRSMDFVGNVPTFRTVPTAFDCTPPPRGLWLPVEAAVRTAWEMGAPGYDGAPGGRCDDDERARPGISYEHVMACLRDDPDASRWVASRFGPGGHRDRLLDRPRSA